MKRVACLSTIHSLPSDNPSSYQVIDIFNSTRGQNSDQQITGAFIISDNLLLMIIEGEATRLANTIFVLRQDKRLKDFSLIMNMDIDKPEFTSWGIKLLRTNSEGQTRFFEKLSNIFRDNLDLKSRLDEQRLDVFLHLCKIPKTGAPSTEQNQSDHQKTILNTNEPNLRDSVISLTGWPKPGKIKLSPELIKVCARLVGRPQHFEDLLNANIVDSEETLLAYLTALHKLDILRKHKVDEKPKLVGIRGGLSALVKPSSTDRFNAVLRNFLAAQKQ